MVVSVPLRGLWFLSDDYFRFNGYGNRFRPLTGIMVLIFLMPLTKMLGFIVLFPSPYGDYGSYQMTREEAIRIYVEFPSPYGDYGSYLASLEC